ncbi:MAG: hypothetical protein NTX82_03885 [Candidatus Parcubacteria bacterium]|nr:hypothetical protein [Candidatus Parcubacteria bacterium]
MNYFHVLSFGEWILFIIGIVISLVAALIFNEAWEPFRQYIFERSIAYIPSQAKKMMLIFLALFIVAQPFVVPPGLKFLYYFQTGKKVTARVDSNVKMQRFQDLR